MTIMDHGERWVFMPWEAAQGRGLLFGWLLMGLGAVWVMFWMVPIILPCLLIEIVKDINNDVRRKS